MTMIVENVDEALSLEKETYKVLKEQDTYILKRFFIKKKKLLYAFIGGMWYSKESFSFKNSISLPYPFSTYYTIKILDKKFRDTHCRSLFYVKMPLLVLQLEDECIAIEFSPFITHDTQEIIPFISLQNKEDNYIISFFLFNKYYLKLKEQAWLGIGKKKRFYFQLKIGDTFRFSTKITKYIISMTDLQT